MSTLTIELPDTLASRLATASAQKHLPPAQIICEALEKALPFADAPKGATSLYERMKSGIGCMDSGVTDLATNPKHMVGYGQRL